MLLAKVKRILLYSLGILSLVLAFLGALLPLLPTVPFLLLAVICFAKSSQKMHDWLLNNKSFGPLIVDWQQRRCMQKRVKVRAIVFIVISMSFSIYMLDLIWLKIFIFCLMLLLIYRISHIAQCETSTDQ